MLWIRSLVISYAVTAGVIVLMTLAYPNMAVPWIKLMFAGLAGLAMIFIACVLPLLLPRRIEVRPEWVHVIHGQAQTRITQDRIDGILIDETDSTRPLLVVLYRTRRGKSATLSITIKPTVDREMLDSLISAIESAVHSNTTQDSALGERFR